jgi:putative cardiolipin synthase
LRAQLNASIDAQRDSPYVTEAKDRFAEKIVSLHKGYYWGKAHLLYDDPAKVAHARDATEGHLMPQFANLGMKIQSELLIVSPYFVPGDKGVEWLRALVARGVRVTVMTNSLAATDVGAVHAGYQRYREALLAGGVRLYEFKPTATAEDHSKREKKSGSGSRASLHAKTFLFDRRAVFIGSLNLDPRSIQLNTEIGVICESTPMAEELAGKLERNLDRIAWRLERVVDAAGNARIVWLETDAGGVRQRLKEPEVSAWRKFSVWFLGLLPIEEML